MRLSFLFAFQRLVKLCIAAYPARFSLNMYRSSLVFARALAILLLLCSSSFAVRTQFLLPCALQCVFMITVAFCGHLPLRRCHSADAVISTGGFPSAACAVLHTHAIYCRVVAVLFFAAFFDLFCVFYANYYGKDCVSVIFLVFLPLPRKTIRHTFFRRFRYCPVYAALRADSRRYRRRRHEFASAAASSLHCFIAE